MKKFLLPALLLMLVNANAQTTLQERLGYKKSDKLIILHADDLGVSHAENEASINALEHGSVSSASIMVPCPWFPEIAAYAAAHPMADFGLHLTLTSEWKYYKWRPVAPLASVPHLVNQYGFMYSAVDSVVNLSNSEEVEAELRAQIERAKQFGIPFTHFDSHMGTLYAKDDYLKVAMKLAAEYKVPLMLSNQILTANDESATGNEAIILDSVYVENPPDFKAGAEAFYTNILNNLKPGVSLIILHAAYDNSEMQAVTIDHPDYGAAWRQADYNFFTSATCRQLLQRNHIRLITWREIRDKLMSK